MEINWIPVTPKENAINLVKDIGKAKGVKMIDTNISPAHQEPSFQNDRTLTIARGGQLVTPCSTNHQQERDGNS